MCELVHFLLTQCLIQHQETENLNKCTISIIPKIFLTSFSLFFHQFIFKIYTFDIVFNLERLSHIFSQKQPVSKFYIRIYIYVFLNNCLLRALSLQAQLFKKKQCYCIKYQKQLGFCQQENKVLHIEIIGMRLKISPHFS